jgi:hypothetical protein
MLLSGLRNFNLLVRELVQWLSVAPCLLLAGCFGLRAFFSGSNCVLQLQFAIFVRWLPAERVKSQTTTQDLDSTSIRLLYHIAAPIACLLLLFFQRSDISAVASGARGLAAREIAKEQFPLSKQSVALQNCEHCLCGSCLATGSSQSNTAAVELVPGRALQSTPRSPCTSAARFFSHSQGHKTE